MATFLRELTTLADEDRCDRRAARRIAYLDAVTRLIAVCQPSLRLGLLLLVSSELSHLIRL
jgi:hypothetical protein